MCAQGDGAQVSVTTYRLFGLDGQGKIQHARTLDPHDDAEAVKLVHAVLRDAVTCEIPGHRPPGHKV
jgi:hypothetical protein